MNLNNVPKDILLQLIPLLSQNSVFVTVDEKNTLTVTLPGEVISIKLVRNRQFMDMQYQDPDDRSFNNQLPRMLRHEEGFIIVAEDNKTLTYDKGYYLGPVPDRYIYRQRMYSRKIIIPEIYTPLIDQALTKLLQ
jgi:hypothetical protein